MILVVNCFNEEPFAVDFDRVVAAHLRAAGAPSHPVRAEGIEALGDAAGFSHLVISGSVASATVDQPWDADLAGLVRRFVAARKPILGICYGHQFLAKALAGPGHVRQAAVPEFGWVEPRLEPNALFLGLQAPLVMASHFDEVHDLPGGFRVLGTSPGCAVHAFQYLDLPVWGVQFHPEYGAGEGDRIWKVVFRDTPERIPAAPAEPARLAQNRLIFRNFVNA